MSHSCPFSSTLSTSRSDTTVSLVGSQLIIRFHRIRMSCSDDPSACPMWSDPVTLGGGSVIEYGTVGLASSASKKPFSIQNLSHRGSTSDGSYCLGSADVVVTRAS